MGVIRCESGGEGGGQPPTFPNPKQKPPPVKNSPSSNRLCSDSRFQFCDSSKSKAASRQMPHDQASRELDYYAILELPRTSASLSKQHVKAAYRRALLRHHPDKTQTPSPLKDGVSLSNLDDKLYYTIDEIALAYATLSDPVARAAYDGGRQLSARGTRPGPAHATVHDGVETHDLEDLDLDEIHGRWYRGCRCGDEQGYILTEDALEMESEGGQIYVACRGCSLWVLVLFGVVDAGAELRGGEQKRSHG